MDEFVQQQLQHFSHRKANVDRCVCSRLSPWIRVGSVSVRRIYYKVASGPAAAAAANTCRCCSGRAFVVPCAVVRAGLACVCSSLCHSIHVGRVSVRCIYYKVGPCCRCRCKCCSGRAFVVPCAVVRAGLACVCSSLCHLIHVGRVNVRRIYYKVGPAADADADAAVSVLL
jgi:hypothetical protein